jgi:hypothetical protein
LNDRVKAIHTGNQKDTLMIREGIKEQDDEATMMEGSKSVKIPSNFADLKNITTSKTSVRKPSDYPVLRERFKKD